MKTQIVKCLSCSEIVEVRLISYGGGEIAACPSCGKLAYNQGVTEDEKTKK